MYWIYEFSNFQLGFFIVFFYLFVGIAGLVISRRWIYNTFRISESTDDSVNGIFSGIGVLIGILLGLVAVATWETYDEASTIVGKEASSVAALYRDISTLEEPAKHELQKNIENYLHYVIDVAWPGHKKGVNLTGGTLILTEFLGTLSEYHAKSEEQKIFLAEVFAEYNRLIEARRIRLDAANAGGVPGVFWIVIISGSLITIIMTYFYHLSSLKTHIALTGFYTAALGLMIFLILTVDNPFRCATSVSSAPYADVLNDLKNLDPVQLKSNDSHT